MKKLLSLALALVATAAVSAQTIGERTDHQAKLRRPAGQTEKMAPKAVEIHHLQASDRQMVSAAATAQMQRIAKAPALLDTYHVSATQVMGNADKTRSKVTWDMTVRDNGDGTYTFTDFLPIPELFSSYATSVSVTGRVVGNQIVINPSKTTISTGTIDVWIGNNRGDANGIIKIDIDEDGSLKLEENTIITYFGVTAGKDFILSGIDKTVLGFFFDYYNTAYTTDVQARYEPKGITLNATMDFMGNGRNRNGGIIPPFTTLSFENKSQKADSYQWHVDEVILNFYTGKYDYVNATFEGTDTDFSFTTNGNFTTYAPVQLKASGKGSNTYTYGSQLGGIDGSGLSKETIFFAGELSDRYALETGETPIMSAMNPDLGYATIADFGTPGIAPQTITDLIMYQGRPEAPLYCEGINIMLYNYEKYGTVRLTCSIHRAERQPDGTITLGDKIAELKKITEATSGAAGNRFTELRFTDFTLYKADGTTRTADHIFIEDEFAIVLSGWDSRTFSATPFGEYYQEEGALTYTYFRVPGDDTIYQYDGNSQRLCVGFYDSGYGHLKSSYDKDVIAFPAKGGGTMIMIDPLVVSNDGSTRLYRDTEEYPIPDWIDMGILPTEEGDDTGDDIGADDSFLLVFIADPLPEGIDSRSAEMELWQEGAKIHFTLKQTRGDVNLDGEVDRTDLTDLVGHIIGEEPELFSADNADLNLDGDIDVLDLTPLIDILLQNKAEAETPKIYWGSTDGQPWNFTAIPDDVHTENATGTIAINSDNESNTAEKWSKSYFYVFVPNNVTATVIATDTLGGSAILTDKTQSASPSGYKLYYQKTNKGKIKLTITFG